MSTRTLSLSVLLAACGSAFGQAGLDLDRAYASELRSDAETRASFLGAESGTNLNISVMTQARYTASFRDEGTVPLGDNDTTLGFSIPRAQVRMSGQITDSITGAIKFDFGAAELNGRNTAGSAVLLEAYGAWKINDGFSLIIGQWQNPVVAEEAIAAEHGLAVDRSATNEFFNPGYTQGIVGAWSGDNWKFAAAFSDGPTYYGNTASLNTPFNSAGESDISLTGRFDYLVSGNWDQFADFASWRGSNYGLKIGLGAHYSSQGDTNPSTITNSILGALDEIDVTLWTADVMVQGDGWNVFAAYVGHAIDPTPVAGTLPDFTNHGVVVQGGVFVSDQTELFARYDAIFLDSVLEGLTGGNESDYHFLTAGVNYFFVPESHAARFTADIVYSASESSTLDVFSPVLGGSDPSTTGLLGLSDSEFAIRGQMTFVF